MLIQFLATSIVSIEIGAIGVVFAAASLVLAALNSKRSNEAAAQIIIAQAETANSLKIKDLEARDIQCKSELLNLHAQVDSLQAERIKLYEELNKVWGELHTLQAKGN